MPCQEIDKNHEREADQNLKKRHTLSTSKPDKEASARNASTESRLRNGESPLESSACVFTALSVFHSIKIAIRVKGRARLREDRGHTCPEGHI